MGVQRTFCRLGRPYMGYGRKAQGTAVHVKEAPAMEMAQSLELGEAELREEVPPVFFAGFHEDSDGHFVPDSSEFWSDSD